MARIHRAAAEGFARSAAAYERGRPGYPDAAVQHLVAQLPPRAGGARPGGRHRQADAAAARGGPERDRGRAGGRDAGGAAGRSRALSTAPPRRSRWRTVRSTPSTVGQAFHWFDGDAALAEIAPRAARRAGCWRCSGTGAWRTIPVNRAIEALLAPYRGDVPTHRGDAWRAAFERTALFGPLEERVFEQRAGARRGRPGGPRGLDQLHRRRSSPPSGPGCSRRVRALAGRRRRERSRIGPRCRCARRSPAGGRTSVRYAS